MFWFFAPSDFQILSKPYINANIIYSAFRWCIHLNFTKLTVMTGFVLQGHIWLINVVPHEYRSLVIIIIIIGWRNEHGSGLGLLETASALFVIRCSLPILQAFISHRSQKNHFRDFNLNNTVMNQARSGGIASQTHSSISPGVTAPWLGIKPMRLPKPGKINPALRECRVWDEIRRRSPLLESIMTGLSGERQMRHTGEHLTISPYLPSPSLHSQKLFNHALIKYAY